MALFWVEHLQTEEIVVCYSTDDLAFVAQHKNKPKYNRAEEEEEEKNHNTCVWLQIKT